MKCENLQFNLSVYSDDILSVEECANVEEHLTRCPLCRQKLADFQALRGSLRGMQRLEMPSDLLASVRSGVAREAGTYGQKREFIFTEDFRRWLLMRFMPYGVGTVASLLLGFMLLWTLFSFKHYNGQNAESAQYEPFAKSSVLLADASPKTDSFELSDADFARARLSVSGESPSVNPQGALVALAKSFVRGEMKDDEVVVVADVFGNGLAQIAEVVEPSRDREAVRELEKALKNDPNFAPFVPANIDHRSDTVRVILKIQSVNVNAH